MSATGSFYFYVGAGSTQETNVTSCNFGTLDAGSMAVSNATAITAGSNSYEKFMKVWFGGTFNYVGSLYWWKSGGTYVTNELIYCTDSGTTAPAYATPVITNSTICTGSIYATQPATMNVHVMSSVIGSLTAAGSSNYIVMQTRTASDTPPGNTNSKTFKLQWTEA